MAAVVLLALTLGACASSEEDGRSPSTEGGESGSADSPAATTDPVTGEWVQLDDMPIPGRNTPTTAWVGGELLLIGGDTFTCPDGADCYWPEGTIRADGAALDPSTGTWHRIADAPEPISGASTAVVGDDLYLLASHGGSDGRQTVLRYRSSDDTWTELPLPGPEGSGWYQLMAADDRVVAWNGSEETAVRPDRIFDAEAETWSDLPAMPITGLFDRRAVWAPPYLYAFGKELAALDESRATVLQMARLDLAAGTWEELPDAPTTGWGPYLVDDGLMVDPDLNVGYRDEPGGPFPHGGVFDIETGEWSELPPPPGDEPVDEIHTVGAFGSTTGFYESIPGGLLLDVAAMRWVEMPALDEDDDVRRRATTAGRDAVVVAGLRWHTGHDTADLLTETWIWRPPAP